MPASHTRSRLACKVILAMGLVLGTVATEAPVQAQLQVLPQDSGADHREGPGWLGILMADSPDGGALVRGTVAGSPAAPVLRRGDVLVALGDQPVSSADALTDRLATVPAGTRIALTVRRNGDEHRLSLVVARRPADLAASAHGHVGNDLPMAELLDVATGQRVRLPTTPHVIALWAEWCSACHRIEPTLRALVDRCGDALPVYTVAPHDGETVRRVARRRNLPGTALADPGNSLAETLSILSLPTWIVVGENHRIDGLAIGSVEIRAWSERADACPAPP